MEKSLNTPKLLQTDSIQELAQFWETHDLTDFDDQLEEVPEPVFEYKTEMQVYLEPEEFQAVSEMAKSRGINSADLIREWVLEKIQAQNLPNQGI